VEIKNLPAGAKHLFPVILSPCGWERHAWLASRQFLPRDGKTDDVFNKAAQPVVGVCWREAQAYCAWLSAQTGDKLTFRLPGEAEWEAAARGPAGRRYAYGDEFDSLMANTLESHVRATTPIGVFAGDNAQGLQDMTGNVWEWTASLYQPYSHDAQDGREYLGTVEGCRVVHGGSRGSFQDLARASFRGIYTPGIRCNDLGFRLCRATPI
jgi:formylglycine-generating enzyme required for sulfatase activity